MRSIVLAATACVLVSPGLSYAQTGVPSQAAPGVQLDMTGMGGNAADRWMERQTNFKRLDDNVEGSRRSLRQYAAKPKDILQGSAIHDMNGLLVGTVAKVGSGFAVVASSIGSVEVDVTSFAKNKNGLLINLPKAKIDAMMSPIKTIK